MKTDVIIAGGGIIGSTIANLLADIGVNVVVIEKDSPKNFLNNRFDGRTSAISQASAIIFDKIGAWDKMKANAHPIKEIRVTEGENPLFVHFDHKQIGSEPLGYIIENGYLRKALIESIYERKSIQYIESEEIKSFTSNPHQISSTLLSGKEITASLLIGADGRFSTIRDMAGIKHSRIMYGQTAIVCIISHEFGNEGIAIEKFLPSGPFAVLPMSGNRAGIVWTESDADAKEYIALNNADFTEEIYERMGGYLGKIELHEGRWSYPLSLFHAERYYTERLLLAGDAAHGIHPIAGQGANLGMRDAAVIADLIGDKFKLGLDFGSIDVLEHYEQWRRFDVFAMMLATDGINRLFSNNSKTLQAARTLGLGIVNKIPSLKKFFILHSMGMLGDLPKVMKQD